MVGWPAEGINIVASTYCCALVERRMPSNRIDPVGLCARTSEGRRLDIITWTLERSGTGARHRTTSYYYQYGYTGQSNVKVTR